MKKIVWFSILILILTGCAALKEKGDIDVHDQEIKEVREATYMNNEQEVDSKDQEQESETLKEEIEVGIHVGKRIPTLALETLEGTTFDEGTIKDKKVLINFWATWCGPCRQEMPDIVRIAQEHEDLIVLGINIGETQEEVASFAEEYQMDFPVLLDRTTELAEHFRILAIPTTYFLNSDGTISKIYPFMIDYEEMKQVYQTLH
ncbi:TlpA family protein disulfide reductase [Caldalkalibacillus mannanilyticus]|uniref:TlpA family protein disulfide reductase n=1 Tax=Caldalkalibacillus mannanilyticus TaxID=1418 RepID=UPI00046AF0E3|nr:TlpA disulfide reductase family protein [Caldalkalibacillus mannanilyticus]